MVFSHYNDGCLFIHILMRLVSLRQLFRGGGPCLRYNYNRSCFIDKYYSKSSQYRKKGFSFPPLVQILIPLLLLKHFQKERSQLPGALYARAEHSSAQRKILCLNSSWVYFCRNFPRQNPTNGPQELIDYPGGFCIHGFTRNELI